MSSIFRKFRRNTSFTLLRFVLAGRAGLPRLWSFHGVIITRSGTPPRLFNEEIAMDKAKFDKGLEVRTAVLGEDCVEASMKNADDFNRPFQEASKVGYGGSNAAIR